MPTHHTPLHPLQPNRRLPPPHLIPQLLRDFLNINIQILPQKLAHVRILHIPTDPLRPRPARAVDIDINGAVAVGAPPQPRAQADHARKRLHGERGARGDGVDLDLERVVDAEALDDELVVDPRVELVPGLRGVGGDVGDEEVCEVFGGGVGADEDRGVPVVDGEFALGFCGGGG